MTGKLNFSTRFRNPDGTYDYSAIDALSNSVANFVTGNDMDPADVQALKDQINERSQVTFNLSDYDKDEEKFGGSVKVLVVTVGAEVHHISTSENVMGGWYFNPTTFEWEENVLCKA